MKKLAVLFLGILLISSGCGSKTTSQQPPELREQPKVQDKAQDKAQDSSVTPQVRTVGVDLYFPDSQGMYLEKVRRNISVVDGAVVKAIIAELQKENQAKVIPSGTRLLKASVKDGIVNLDFSKEFRDKHWGGSSGESMTIYSIVNSLTELPNITGVQFYLEGKVQESILGHADSRQPFTRNSALIRP